MTRLGENVFSRTKKIIGTRSRKVPEMCTIRKTKLLKRMDRNGSR